MTVAADDRTDCLERHVATLVAQGWRVESQGRFQAVVSKQQPRNLAVNLFLTVVTSGLWLPVWYFLAARNSGCRRMVAVDPLGNVTSQQVGR